jgi:omega-amidase
MRPIELGVLGKDNGAVKMPTIELLVDITTSRHHGINCGWSKLPLHPRSSNLNHHLPCPSLKHLNHTTPNITVDMAGLLKKPVRLALVQLACTPDKAQNLSHARIKVLEAAKKHQARIVVLPECFNSPYGTKYFPKFAETLLPSPPTEAQSPSFHALSKMASEAKVYLIGGSIPEIDPSSKALYNTSLTFSPTGKLLATHRKIHLFDIDIPGKITFRESEVLSPGNQITMIDLPEYGKIAVAICYDVRFPELATIAARKGAFLLLYPGAFNMTTGPAHWELLARSRAIDNETYVGLCSPARDISAEYHAWGHSVIVDPNAEILDSLDENEGIAVADLKGERIEEVRKGIPIYSQRRFDVYADVSAVGPTA